MIPTLFPVHATTVRRGLLDAGRTGFVLFGLLLATAASEAANPYPLSHGFHFVEQDGESLYHAICQGCHMPEGQGAQGAGRYPALAANAAVGSAPYITHNVLYGRHGMPGFGAALDDAQVAAVVNYVRTHLGNHYGDPVSTEDVKKARAAGG